MKKNVFAFLALAILLVTMFGQIQDVHAGKPTDIIRFVGSASSNVTNARNIITVNYTSSTGNFVVVSVQNYPNCPANSVTDTGGSVYSLLVNNTLGGGGSYLQVWGTTGSGSRESASISITIRNNGATCSAYPWNTYNSVIVAEYSGASDTLGATVEGVSAAIGSATATCSIKKVAGNDWLVTAFAISRYATVTPNTGDLRNASFSGFQQGALVDTKGAPTHNKHHFALNLSDPGAAIQWYCAGVELRTPKRGHNP